MDAEREGRTGDVGDLSSASPPWYIIVAIIVGPFAVLFGCIYLLVLLGRVP